MKIYLACALTHVPRDEFDDYVRFLHDTAEHLKRELGAEVKYALRDSDPQLAEKPFNERARLCYLWDKEMVEWADVVVAEASFPSTGLGIELQIAASHAIPITILFQTSTARRASPVAYENPDHTSHHLQVGEGYVSLMALGLPSVVKVIPYDSPIRARDAICVALSVFRG